MACELSLTHVVKARRGWYASDEAEAGRRIAESGSSVVAGAMS